jgi:hypothetical protein
MHDQIKVDEKGMTFGTHWPEEKCFMFGEEARWKDTTCSTKPV